jgi:hypothetical protein
MPLIKFPCKCGHTFNLTEDQAGGLVQCPRCGLLADVPTLNDAAVMNDDGTFGLQPAGGPAEKITDRYKPITLDENITPRVAPRYDPVTGELIRPLQIKDEEPVPVLSIGVPADSSEVDAIPLPVISIPAPVQMPVKSLGYAVGDTRKHVTLLTVALELLMPANTAVMFFVFLLYVTGHFICVGIHHFLADEFPTLWPFLIVNLPMWLIPVQMGCAIEDTGPDAIDELPRPLRNFSFDEDIFVPLFRVMLAIAICFTPAVFLYRKLDPANPMTIPIVLTFTAIGSWLFPAIVLTTVTGTTVLNLRPDRLFSVIKQCGLAYPVSVVLFLLTAIPTVYFVMGPLLFQPPDNKFFHRIDSPTLALPIMLMAVYLLHYFCWHMGLMYRENHGRFPWLAQRHIKTERPKKTAPRAIKQTS